MSIRMTPERYEAGMEVAWLANQAHDKLREMNQALFIAAGGDPFKPTEELKNEWFEAHNNLRNLTDAVGLLVGRHVLVETPTGIVTEMGEIQPFTLISDKTGKAYTSPFEVNIWAWQDDEHLDDEDAVGPYIGRGTIIGAEYSDDDEPMPYIVDINDGSGELKASIGLFLAMTIPEEDGVIEPEVPRISFDEYMST